MVSYSSGVLSPEEYFSDYILSYLFTPSVASSEHIIAVSKGGKDKLSNVQVFCKRCNRSRGNLSYVEFTKYHPEMIKNEQRQNNQIAKYILNNDVTEEATYYPIEVAKTLSEATNGKINLDVSQYCEARNKQINQRIQEQKEDIQRLREERQQMNEEKLALIKRLEEIEQTQKENKKEIQNIDNNISKEKSLSSKFQKCVDKNLHSH